MLDIAKAIVYLFYYEYIIINLFCIIKNLNGIEKKKNVIVQFEDVFKGLGNMWTLLFIKRGLYPNHNAKPKNSV